MSYKLNDSAGFGSSVDTGFNPDKINELMADLSTSYKSLGEALQTGYTHIRGVMANNWIGPDELDAEQVIADQVIKLYNTSAELVQEAINNMKTTGQAWMDFSNKNVLRVGDDSQGIAQTTIAFDLDAPTVAADQELISSIAARTDVNFTSDMSYGVVSDGDKAILSAFESYEDTVQTAVDNIKNNLDSSGAFIGKTQSSAIDTYLESVVAEAQKLVTSLDSISSQVQQLTTTGYQQAAEDVSSAFSNPTSDASTTEP